MGIILRGGIIIIFDKIYISDLRIEDEKIVEIGNNLEINGDKVIDVIGKIVIFGGIDIYIYFDMNVGFIIIVDNFEIGIRVVIVGGIIIILDFVEVNEGENLL